jgi:phosphoribosylamine--glycine ligase
MSARDRINILILGSGGREHAMAHALSSSEIAGGLHCAPGNPGIGRLAQLHDVDPCDAGRVLGLCGACDIRLVAVGPEAPLASGVADVLRDAGVLVFGPGRAGAALESSKAFAKRFMLRHGVPTQAFDICSEIGECEAAFSARKPPYVIKADGLAAGKGVFLPDNRADAAAICRDLLVGKKLGDAGSSVVIEDFAPGSELTVFAVTDGKSYRILSPSRDHKRAFDGDRGPNTGGMGAYSPVALPPGVMERAEEEVLRPTLAGLAADGIEYRGVIYMGLMLSETAKTRDRPKISVIEYNVRFGDPEAQAVLPLIRGDFGRLLLACAEGDVASAPAFENSGTALCVVAASGGYPGEYRKGLPIGGLDDDVPGTFVYHAGTALTEDGTPVTSGGRVLSVVGTGATFGEARERAYARISRVSFEGMRFRRDIGWSEELQEDGRS